jgi:alpha-D-ribose 1-methylphosphonate 5-phosphate C-P lyase
MVSTVSSPTRQIAAPPKAVFRAWGSGGLGVAAVVIGTDVEFGVEVLAAGAKSVLTAARASTVPWPTSAFHPAGG